MSRRRPGPRVHFSFRSPFSWIALHRLERLVPDVFARVELVPYYDPDERSRADLEARDAEFHYAPMSKAKHLYILYDVRRQVQRHDLRMTWPVDDDPHWEVPHLAWLRAVELGAGREFYAAVVAARWERGEDVCRADTVGALAEGCGLPGDELAGATESEDLRARGVEGLVRAYEDDVFGVPYFRLGRERFWGLDRVDDFAAALEGSGPTVPPPPAAVPAAVPSAVVERVGGYDHDTAGGCG